MRLERSSIVAAVAVAAALAGCKRTQHTSAGNDLPDLNAQTRTYVTQEPTRVRTGPGSQFRTIGEIGSNAKVQVVGRDGEWVLIVSKKGNAPGYIEMASVKPATGREEEEKQAAPPVEGKYQVLADTQVHSGPGLQYPVVAKIKKGMHVNVVNEEPGWLKVESKQGNPPGYIDSNLAKPAQNDKR